jgi:hypothetical protein
VQLKAQVQVQLLFAPLWALAGQGSVARVALCTGSIGAEAVTAPLAVYHMVSPWRDEVYVFIQHGSYQLVSIAQQPRLESGEVLLASGLNVAIATFGPAGELKTEGV